MREAIQSRKDYYNERYQLIPEFNAGLQCGMVTVTWVGTYRKEIVYFGDVLNTTKRLEESCKRLDRDFLVSKEVLSLFKDKANLSLQLMEAVALRGKEEPTEIYSVDKV